MSTEAIKTRAKQEFSLTDKQANYVAISVEHGGELNSTFDAIKKAGYRSKSMTVTRTNEKVQAAIRAELARKAEIEKKAEQLRQALAENPREAITNKLAQHAEDATIAPNQTRAVELLAKISGVMIERVEIDPGEFLRSRLGAKLYGEENG